MIENNQIELFPALGFNPTDFGRVRNTNRLATPVEAQMDQNRLNVIDQEVFRLEQEITEQKAIQDECDNNIKNLDDRLNVGNSALSFSQKLEKRLEFANRKKEALEKEVRLGRQLGKLQIEHDQIVSRLKSHSVEVPHLSSPLHQMTNLYLEAELTHALFDVFISHASEDKASFVNEFVEELRKRNIKVWVDELRIKWGDSLRKSIDEGLKKSRYGIVVISHHFIAKGWTQYELDGLFEREMSSGKVILPIWHHITKKEVEDFSPSLALRKALTTDNMTPADIAEELVSLLKDMPSPSSMV